MRWLHVVLLTLLLGPALARAQTAAPISGFCVNGAKPAITSGLPSSNYNQNLIPKCTVAVFLTGTTTPATIYSDANKTPLANPFTANTDASWTFYVAIPVPPAQSLVYDVVLSGGIAPNTYSLPRTITGLELSAASVLGNLFVLKAGDTMTGALNIAPPSGTAASLILKSTGTSPSIQFQNTSAALDTKNWAIGTTGDGTYHLSISNDAGSAGADVMTCTRAGITPGLCTFPGGVSAPNLVTVAPPIATIQGSNFAGKGLMSSGEIIGNAYATPEAAVAAACASSKAVYFPAGVYNLTTGLAVCGGLTIRGVGSDAVTQQGTSFKFPPGAAIWGLFNPFSDCTGLGAPHSDCPAGNYNAQGLHIQDIAFDMSADPAALGALHHNGISASLYIHVSVKTNNNPNPAITEDGINYQHNNGDYDNTFIALDLYDVAPASASTGTGFLVVNSSNNNMHYGGRVARFGTNLHIASSSNNNAWYGTDMENWQQYCVQIEAPGGGNKFDRFRCESGLGPWTASAAVGLGLELIDSNANRERVTTAGTNAATPPTWCTAIGCTTTSGTATYTLDRILPADVMITGSTGNSLDVYISGYETGVVDTTGGNTYPYPNLAGAGITGLGNAVVFSGFSNGQRQTSFLVNTSPFDTSTAFSGDCADGWFYGCMSVTGYPNGGEIQATRAFILCNISAGCNPIPTSPNQNTATYSRFINHSTGPQDVYVPDNGGFNIPSTMLITGQNFNLTPVQPATATNNYSSKQIQWQASYWNGTAPTQMSFQAGLSMNPGTTPQANLIFGTAGDNAGSLNYYFETNTTAQSSVNLYNIQAATSSLNIPAHKLAFLGNAWNGTSSAITSWTWTPTVAAGANPVATMALRYLGPNAAAATLSLPTITTIGTFPVATDRGVVTLAAGTVTVTSANACSAATGCVYSLTNCGPAGTAIGVPSLGTVTVGTNFIINSMSATNTVATGDTSKICWEIN